MTESPPSIDMHGVKRDLDKIYWCILNHLTQSSMGARTLNPGDSVFLYTGVPQGSILDLLLFIIVIDDITLGLSNSSILYADDNVTLMAFIKTKEEIEKCYCWLAINAAVKDHLEPPLLKSSPLFTS